ncbi:MAG: DNA polymerase III subunit gamma/tau [Candidatus Poribacteria bacterium]|nr:DNA polymerase III subunit gamma/tau [Candidatus Poribacteria bacterium]MDE0504203.1 DNA polymerase III subunit gamma/tau [Candidatus Poribacteria bacterium]
MSYEVIAQKWRPQSFHQVIGQEHVIKTLQNQIRLNRIGHAYLFWGPRGTGKTTVARLFAKAVNCAERDSDAESVPDAPVEPCNECAVCLEIAQGRSFDVIELDAASNRGIDPIRELRENTKLAPAACSFKIYIIDEAHMLTPEAFNALLKTLEEPPPHVIFILATTEHHKVPKTIVSRCQDFDFRYMELSQIISRLELICSEEGIDVDDQALSLIARQSEGCLRDAENALERIISATGKTLDVEAVDQILGLGSSPLIDKLVDTILDCNLPDSMQVLASLTNQGADLTQCLHQLIAYFRNLRLLAINKDLANLIQGSGSDIQGMKERAADISVERLSRIIKILMRTSSEIKRYGNAQIQLESSLVEINSIGEGFQLGEVLKRLGEIENRIDRSRNESNQPQSDVSSSNTEAAAKPPVNSLLAESRKSFAEPPPPKTAAVPAASNDAPANAAAGKESGSSVESSRAVAKSSAELEQIWKKAMANWKTGQRSLHGFFKDASLSTNEEGELEIACDPRNIVVLDPFKNEIVKMLGSLIGHSVDVRFVPGRKTSETNKSKSAKDGGEGTSTRLALQREAERDPQLSPVLELFDAKILTIDLK